MTVFLVITIIAVVSFFALSDLMPTSVTFGLTLNGYGLWDKQILTYSIDSSDTLFKNKEFIVENTISGSGSVITDKYLSWNNALELANSINPTVPDKFVRVERNADIIVVLSNLSKEHTGGSAQNSVNKFNYIQSSRIIVYNTDSTDNAQLESIIRHEFGHVLGLDHNTDRNNLMNNNLSFLKFAGLIISQSNIDDLAELYVR